MVYLHFFKRGVDIHRNALRVVSVADGVGDLLYGPSVSKDLDSESSGRGVGIFIYLDLLRKGGRGKDCSCGSKDRLGIMHFAWFGAGLALLVWTMLVNEE